MCLIKHVCGNDVKTTTVVLANVGIGFFSLALFVLLIVAVLKPVGIIGLAALISTSCM